MATQQTALRLIIKFLKFFLLLYTEKNQKIEVFPAVFQTFPVLVSTA